jgi:hypothetical protein
MKSRCIQQRLFFACMPAVQVFAGSNRHRNQIVALRTDDARLREITDLEVLLSFSGGSSFTVPSISGASA